MDWQNLQNNKFQKKILDKEKNFREICTFTPKINKSKLGENNSQFENVGERLYNRSKKKISNIKKKNFGEKKFSKKIISKKKNLKRKNSFLNKTYNYVDEKIKNKSLRSITPKNCEKKNDLKKTKNFLKMNLLDLKKKSLKIIEKNKKFLIKKKKLKNNKKKKIDINTSNIKSVFSNFEDMGEYFKI